VSQAHPSVTDRVEAALRAWSTKTPGDVPTWVVAVSGGLDSSSLLHLLRFGVEPVLRGRLVAAHLDHALRPGSAGDAAFVRGLCRSWDVPLIEARLTQAPKNEADARRRRYEFLRSVAGHAGAAGTLTAHTRDDQAETVLLRATRGTGLSGLAGIQPRRVDGVSRPLLDVSRAELEGYAGAVGLNARQDPTNRDLSIRRNAIRHEVLPRLRARGAPGVTRALARLADRAREWRGASTALAELALDAVLADARASAHGGGIVLDAPKVAALPDEARAWVLRAACERMHVPLSGTGTRVALEFSRRGPSGRTVCLPGGLRLTRVHSHLLLHLEGPPVPDATIRIDSPTDGPSTGRLGRRALCVETRRAAPREAEGWEAFALDRLRFPLHVRAWRAGDRMRFAYGRKKVKKLFQEGRLPTWQKRGQPLLVDGMGEVLWVPGMARSVLAVPSTGDATLYVGVRDA